METYATDSPSCSAKLRRRPEDFIVEEALGRVEVSSEPLPGQVPLYRVEKRGADTLHVEAVMAEALKSRIAHAGLKDKRAATVQHMSPTSSRAERPPVVERSDFRATLVGYLPRPISRSMVIGNRFRIVMRECCREVESHVAEVLEAASSLKVPNFYGLQRFGARSPTTHLVGKALVRGRFEEAVNLMLCEPRSTDDESTREARRMMLGGRYGEAARLLPPGQDTERLVANHLARNPRDAVGAIRRISITLRRLYVQAFQSYLFNRTVSIAMKGGVDIWRLAAGDNWGTLAGDGLNVAKVHGVKDPAAEGGVPLVQVAGYAYRNYGSRFDACLEEAMRDQEVQPREFFVREMQEVSSEGGFRRPHLAVIGARSARHEDDVELDFTLPRGGYATVLLREIIKPADPFLCGFG
jgi:tRNA pseudouridine13 synthase